ncbi:MULTISPECIES: HIRAN domain-containing protein [unclassified Novosphingobium]|uniref:HIRAN domain-containing protein n=1 Tax=unclassified Novosphingobium TaxID=2644732 RepID=UPI001F3DB1D6|nr:MULTISPECIES: HIRAN domain-containing protein [unclassified Novosphingobium]
MTTPPSMSLAVVGAAFPNADGSNRQFETLLCQAGEPVTLVPEPRNKNDPHAIAVFSIRDVQIGYISAERAPRLGALISSFDAQAVFQRKADFGAWIRVSFDGAAPQLTGAMLVEPDDPDVPLFDPEPDFYPDEIWPDD